MKTTAEITQLFIDNLRNARKYKKFGRIAVQTPVEPRVVTTVTADGKETVNEYQPEHDVIVTNLDTSAKEQYVMPKTTLTKRYVPTGETHNGWPIYAPVGEVIGFKYSGETVEFNAPWGEPMVLKNGDMLVDSNCVSVDDATSARNIYRIAAQEFSETYR